MLLNWLKYIPILEHVIFHSNCRGFVLTLKTCHWATVGDLFIVNAFPSQSNVVTH